MPTAQRTSSRRRTHPVIILVVFTAALHLTGSGSSRSDEHTRVIYVDQTHGESDDLNSGTRSEPLRTIGRAIALAETYNARALPVRVIVQPGTYRESIRITSHETSTAAPITLKGVGSGVVVSGSDAWGNWTGGNGKYSHAWLHDWGLASASSEWPGYVHAYLDANPVIRRQEMVFIDGEPLLQVMSLDELNRTENSFFVSEETDQLLLHIPSQTNIAAAEVEVAIRPSLLAIDSRQNVHIDNLTFQHAANPLQWAAVRVAQSENVSMVDTRFIWNSARGLGISESGTITVENASALHNGISGFTGYRVHELRVVDSEASYNGWRSARGWDRDNHASAVDANFIDFATGQKFFGLRNASFHNYRAVGNLTGGLWLDFDNSGVVLDGLDLAGNMTHGLFLEASQGPISVVRSRICHNETGVLIGNASNVQLTDSLLAGNELGQIYLVGANGPRFVEDHETGNQLSVRAEDWVIKRNTIAVDDGTLAIGTLLEGDLWYAFVQSLEAEGNRYSSPLQQDVFQLPGSRNMSFGQWKEETGKDAGSSFNDRHVGCPLPAGTIAKANKERPTWFVLIALVSACAVATAFGVVAVRHWRDMERARDAS